MSMTLKEWIYGIGFILSALASIGSWISNIYWSKKRKEAYDDSLKAKDEIIKAKEAIIEKHEIFCPKNLEEWVKSTQAIAEQYVNAIKVNLNEANNKIKNHEEQIKILGHEKVAEIKKLEDEKNNLLQTTNQLNNKINELNSLINSYDNNTISFKNLWGQSLWPDSSNDALEWLKHPINVFLTNKPNNKDADKGKSSDK